MDLVLKFAANNSTEIPVARPIDNQDLSDYDLNHPPAFGHR